MTLTSRAVCAATPPRVITSEASRLHVGSRMSVLAISSEFVLLEDARVDGAGFADIRRLIRGEPVTEGVEDVTIPDLLHAVVEHVAHVGPVGRGDHAAGHHVAGVADIAAAPRPTAPLAAGRSWRVGPRLSARQPEIDTQRLGGLPGEPEEVLDPHWIVFEQRLRLHELTHRSVVGR